MSNLCFLYLCGLFQVFEGLEFLENLLQLELSSEEVCKWVWLVVDGLEGVVYLFLAGSYRFSGSKGCCVV